MDLKQIINQVSDIHNGFKNTLLSKIGQVSDEIIVESVRLEKICMQCPLLKDLRCDTSKEIEVVVDFEYYGKKFKKGDKVKGCGCNLNIKWMSTDAKCPKGAWQFPDIQIVLPQGFMNIGIANNKLIADTNDSANWKTFEASLPSNYNFIKSVNGNIVTIGTKLTNQ